jgi:hypothetical protein
MKAGEGLLTKAWPKKVDLLTKTEEGLLTKASRRRSVDEGIVELGGKGVDVALRTWRCRKVVVALMSNVSTKALEQL